MFIVSLLVLLAYFILMKTLYYSLLRLKYLPKAAVPHNLLWMCGIKRVSIFKEPLQSLTGGAGGAGLWLIKGIMFIVSLLVLLAYFILMKTLYYSLLRLKYIQYILQD